MTVMLRLLMLASMATTRTSTSTTEPVSILPSGRHQQKIQDKSTLAGLVFTRVSLDRSIPKPQKPQDSAKNGRDTDTSWSLLCDERKNWKDMDKRLVSAEHVHLVELMSNVPRPVDTTCGSDVNWFRSSEVSLCLDRAASVAANFRSLV